MMKPLHILIIDENIEKMHFYQNLLQEADPVEYHISLYNPASPARNPHALYDCIIIAEQQWEKNVQHLLHSLSKEYGHSPALLILTNQEQPSNPIAAAHTTLAKAQANKERLCKEIHYAIEKNQLNEKIQAQQETLQQLTYYHPVSGLPNRFMFENIIKETLARCSRYHRNMALLLFEIDNFNLISDTYPQSICDKLIQEVSARIQANMRQNDLVAHFDGAKFSIILDETEQVFGSASFADRLLQLFNDPFTVESHQIYLTISIGIATYPECGKNWEQLLKNANIALYRTRHQTSSTYQFYNKDMDVQLHNTMNLRNALHQAYQDNKFSICYQLKFDLNTLQAISAEGLIRWEQQPNQFTPPSEFIPIAEKTGLIVPIGYSVLERVCQDIRHLQQKNIDLPMAVNLSSRQLFELDFVDNALMILGKYQISPKQIEFELTESAIMENPEVALSTLQLLRKNNFSLSIDDFGTGYSSLSYIKKLPIQTLKIDQSFIHDITSDKQNKAIVKTVIDLCHALKINVLAEGIETAQQLALLQQLGCQLGQGYHLAKPLPLEQLQQFIISNANIKHDID